MGMSRFIGSALPKEISRKTSHSSKTLSFLSNKIVQSQKLVEIPFINI
jgi:hypothetical protein